MGSAIEGMPKRHNYSNGMKAFRPSGFGTGKGQRFGGKLSKKAIALRAKESARLRQATAKEILGFYKQGCPGLTAKERSSRHALAQFLLRRGIVTTTSTHLIVSQVLEALEAKGKIALPQKSKTGGARQKKK